MDSTGLPVELGGREGEIPSTESWPARGDRNSRDRMMGGGRRRRKGGVGRHSANTSMCSTE